MLASGSGTNLQALLDTPEVRPHIALVVSDNPDARALTRARGHDVAVATVRWADHDGREPFSEALADAVEASGAKGVVLAGFMRILGPGFISRFPDRILNIHPSLLPAFPGSHAVESALDSGVEVTGVTVHFVDDKVDNGPIVAQAPVQVHPGDDVATLHGRIQAEEHRLYPRIVRAFVEGRLELSEGEVVMR
ncbi:MAG: phosphoribosylglycinamide formyltransferase [Acidimicrobiia bacterium]